MLTVLELDGLTAFSLCDYYDHLDCSNALHAECIHQLVRYVTKETMVNSHWCYDQVVLQGNSGQEVDRLTVDSRGPVVQVQASTNMDHLYVLSPSKVWHSLFGCLDW